MIRSALLTSVALSLSGCTSVFNLAENYSKVPWIEQMKANEAATQAALNADAPRVQMKALEAIRNGAGQNDPYDTQMSVNRDIADYRYAVRANRANVPRDYIWQR